MLGAEFQNLEFFVAVNFASVAQSKDLKAQLYLLLNTG